MSDLILFIQRISVRWTKQSRGHPGASLRSAIPDLFPIPEIRKNSEILFHHLRFEERRGFEEPEETVRPMNAGQARKQLFEYYGENDSVSLVFHKPNPHDFYGGTTAKRLGQLSLNSWIRIYTNGYGMGTARGRYWQDTRNVFWGEIDKIDLVMRKNPPLKIHDFRLELL